MRQLRRCILPTADMNWTIDQLKQTKVGQMPANQAVLAQHPKYDKDSPVGSIPTSKSKQNTLPTLVEVPKGSRHRKRKVLVIVTLIRCGTNLLDDDDNLPFAFKATKDVISTVLGVDDADRRVAWQYGQLQTKGEKGTIVTIETV